jgi:hypothetical protein
MRILFKKKNIYIYIYNRLFACFLNEFDKTAAGGMAEVRGV